MADFYFKANKGSASVQSIAIIVAAASSPRRAKINEYTLGCGAAPGDNVFTHIVQRCTTGGTGSALTPNAADQGDTLASTIVCKDTVTVDPTLTSGAFLGWKALNQRSTFRWVSVPGKELVTPATASNGFMFGLSSATTTSFDTEFGYTEF